MRGSPTSPSSPRARTSTTNGWSRPARSCRTSKRSSRWIDAREREGCLGALSGPGTEGERQAGSVVTRDAAPAPDRGLAPEAAHPPWQGHVLMSPWTPKQLDAIRATDDIHISPYRAGGTTPGTPTSVWHGGVDDDQQRR